MNNWTNFIKPELLILIPVLYCFGMGIKRSEIRDKYIPAVLGAAGIIFAALYVVATIDVYTVQAVAMGVFTACVQGVLCAGMSVYGDQLIKQTKKEDNDCGKSL